MGKKLTKEEFIKKARSVHGDKYGYDKVEYYGVHTKVCIICPERWDLLAKLVIIYMVTVVQNVAIIQQLIVDVYHYPILLKS